MKGDRVEVYVGWMGGSHSFLASLVTGDAEMKRALSAKGFRKERSLRLSDEELARLREVAATVRASDQDLVDYDFWEVGGMRVEVWRGDEHIVVKVDRGRIHEGGAHRLAELAHTIVNGHLPWPSAEER